jgi:hypothetical protein
MLTLEEAKSLRAGQIVFLVGHFNADGTSARWKVNGKVKIWKRDAFRVQVPLKHGLYNHGYITEDNLELFSLIAPESCNKV